MLIDPEGPAGEASRAPRPAGLGQQPAASLRNTMRLLIFLACLATGTAALTWAAGSWYGRDQAAPEPQLPRSEAPPGGARVPLTGSAAASGSMRLKEVGAPRYAMPEALTYRDAHGGERVDIPHYIPWAFSARGARAVVASTGDDASIIFDDVTVLTYREPASLDEARRLRDDPRAIEDFVRLELFAPRARADGVARALQSESTTGDADTAIVLDGGVEVRDRKLEILARGAAVSFDPRSHETVGQGRFTVEHAAWTLEGEGFRLTPEVRAGRPQHDGAFRLEIDRNVLLAVRENVLDPQGGPLWRDDEFRPSRVFAGRAAVVHDAAAPGGALHVALENGVRGLQEGGRRMHADRLNLALEPRTAGGAEVGRGWRLAHLTAEGRPLSLEVPDIEARGSRGAARVTARRLRHEPSPFGPATTVLEGEPVLLFEGDLALAGVSGPGRWIRASATERALLLPAPGVAVGPDGAPVVGRRLELRGRARLERRTQTEGAVAEDQDVLEGDEISLLLRPAQVGDDAQAREIPVSFSALGHVLLSGTRLEGSTERLVVEGLDTRDPLLIVEGLGTRLALVGLERGQRMLGVEKPPSEGAEDGAPAGGAAATPRRAWTLDHLEASGRLAAETRLGGPTVGVPAWVDGEQVTYDRIADRALLLGAAGVPASIQLEAAAPRRHGLSAPRIAFELGRGRLRAEGGARAEVHLLDDAPAGLPGSLGGQAVAAGQLRRFELLTNGRIEVQLRVSSPGGEPAPDSTQTLRVLAPFTAELRAPLPEAADRLRAQRLEVAFALRTPPERSRPSSALARASRPAPATTATSPRSRAASGPPARWVLASRTLVLDLEGGALGGLEATGGVTVDNDALHLESGSLRFVRALGSLWLEGDGAPIRARLGRGSAAESRLVARALRVALDDAGPVWVLASGPVQAVLVQEDPQHAGRATRYEVQCPGDVKLTQTDLVAEATTTWIRRTERAQAGAPWGAASDVWADRITATGTGLLTTKRGSPAAVRTLTATGPHTAFRSGEGAARVDMWCERIDVEIETGRAVLSGRPGRDVLVHFESGYDVELMRASFDFRTGEVQDLEAGRAVLRRGR